MKYYHLIAIGIILVIVFFLGKSCSGDVKIDSHDKDSIIKQLREDLDARNTLEGIASAQTDTVTKWKDRWHKAKTIHDTIPCEEKLPIVINTCDSTIIAFERLNENKDSIISLDGRIIKGYQKVAKIDSLTIDSLLHSSKKFWKGFKIGLGIGFGAGVIGGGLVR